MAKQFAGKTVKSQTSKIASDQRPEFSCTPYAEVGGLASAAATQPAIEEGTL